MNQSTLCFFFFVLLVTSAYARIHPVVHQTPTPDAVIANACQPSLEKALCISVLKSQTIIRDLKQATFVALRAASVEAVATSEMIMVTRQKEEDKDVVEDAIEEETLADCSQSYTNIVEMLVDATSALLTGPESDVRVDINAAITTAETCANSIKKGRKSRHVEQVAKKNENVKKFCSNALSIYDVYAKGH